MNMYTNVYNAWDKNFLSSFISSLYHPEMEYTSTEVGKTLFNFSTIPALIYLNGILDYRTGARKLIRSVKCMDRYLQVLLDQFNAHPDASLRIITCQLIARSDKTALVVADIVMEGTLVRTITPEVSEEVLAASEDATGYQETRRSENLPHVVYQPFIFDGTIKLHIDSSRRINQMEFMYNWGKPLSAMYK